MRGRRRPCHKISTEYPGSGDVLYYSSVECNTYLLVSRYKLIMTDCSQPIYIPLVVGAVARSTDHTWSLGLPSRKKCPTDFINSFGLQMTPRLKIYYINEIFARISCSDTFPIIWTQKKY